MSAQEAKFPDPGLDYRKHPEAYRIGRGEQGVLTVEPYKGELLPLWRFRTEAEARRSVRDLIRAFMRYKRAKDFVGMDMARKFLQMGFTRARRYARHRGGRKYDESGGELPETLDAEKQAAAEVFKSAWDRVRGDEVYKELKVSHQRAVSSRKDRRGGER